MTTAGLLVLISFALCCAPDTAFGIETSLQEGFTCCQVDPQQKFGRDSGNCFYLVDCSAYPNITNEEGKEVPVCRAEVRPICGSDGVSYDHECQLCAYNVQYGTNVSKDHDGECKEAAPVDCSRYPNITSEEGKVELLCKKDRIPICGTDWVTYDNECQLCARNLAAGTRVGKKTDGECKKETVRVDCSDYPKPVCALDDMPLCGSDNTTYSNKCNFCNAVMDSNGTITLRHFGKC